MILTELGAEALAALQRPVPPPGSGWTDKHGEIFWALECISRDHPDYGPVAPGWSGAPDRCLCGARFY